MKVHDLGSVGRVKPEASHLGFILETGLYVEGVEGCDGSAPPELAKRRFAVMMRLTVMGTRVDDILRLHRRCMIIGSNIVL